MKKLERYIFLKKIFDYISDKNKIILLIAVRLLLMGMELIPAFLLMLFVNYVLPSRDNRLLEIIFFIFLFSFLVQFFLKIYEVKIKNNIFNNAILNVKKALIKKYLKANIFEIEELGYGEVTNIIDEDVKYLSNLLESHCFNFLMNLLGGIIYIFLLLYIQTKLALIGIIMIPISFGLTNVMSKKAEEYSKRYRDEYGKYENFVVSVLKNWREVKATEFLNYSISKINRYWETLQKSFMKYQIYWYVNRFFVAFKDNFIVKMSIYIAGGYLIYLGMFNVGSLLLFLGYYEKFVGYISSIVELMMSFKIDKIHFEKIFTILDKKSNVKKIPMELDRNENSVMICDLYFKYPKSKKWIFENYSLEIYGNGLFAIVGENGVGKSTLLKIIAGIYSASGKIEINGFNPFVYDLTGVISMVLQEPVFLNLSIYENFLLIKNDLTFEEMDNLMQKVNMKKIIDKMPDKYNTLLGKGGVNLSGGEKQRLALARAVIMSSKVLLLDEISAALDKENESIIIQYLNELSKTKLIIAVTHHEEMIKAAQNVIRLE